MLYFFLFWCTYSIHFLSVCSLLVLGKLYGLFSYLSQINKVFIAAQIDLWVVQKFNFLSTFGKVSGNWCELSEKKKKNLNETWVYYLENSDWHHERRASIIIVYQKFYFWQSVIRDSSCVSNCAIILTAQTFQLVKLYRDGEMLFIKRDHIFVLWRWYLSASKLIGQSSRST